MDEDYREMTRGVRFRFAWLVLRNRVRLASITHTPGLATAQVTWRTDTEN